MCGTENCITGIQSRIYWCRLVYLGKISKRRPDFKLFLKKGSDLGGQEKHGGRGKWDE